MNEKVQQAAFFELFQLAYHKCFGHPCTTHMSEGESKQLSSRIFEATGLVIGAKSLKNYSLHLHQPNVSRKANPSLPTLDTLARYVAEAPMIDERVRSAQQSHYPYWHQFLAGYRPSDPIKEPDTRDPVPAPAIQPRKQMVLFGLTALFLIPLIIFLLRNSLSNPSIIQETFFQVSEDTLFTRGWKVMALNADWWKQRDRRPGYLTLYTLTGDSWPDSVLSPRIQNLLVRPIGASCFETEVHISDFVPRQNWQQAGLILLEDTTLQSKSLRVTLGYNDFFGGYSRPAEILIQAVMSSGGESAKPEELVHLPIFTFENDNVQLINYNLHWSALKIEKQENHFRLFYSASPFKNFAYKEILKTDLSFQPRYLGVFALKGFTLQTTVMPVYFHFFGWTPLSCRS